MIKNYFILRSWAKARTPQWDDFAQSVAIKWLEGKRLSSSFRHLLIDYMRSQPRFEEAPERSAEDVHSILNLRLSKMDLTQTERVCLVLTSLWGFSNRETGHVLGLTESRISQILKRIRR